jgi:hypothetical protein
MLTPEAQMEGATGETIVAEALAKLSYRRNA